MIEGARYERFLLASVSDRRVTRTHVEGLRTSSAAMIQVQVQDLLRLHSERIAVACISDIFAIAEAELPANLRAELKAFGARAAREFRDLPNEEARQEFLAELLEMDPAQAPASLRDAVVGMEDVCQEGSLRLMKELRARWDAAEPAVVKLARPAPASTAINASSASASPRASRAAAEPKAPKAVATKTPKPRVVKTPAHMVDPNRAESIRADVLDRLRTPEYGDRGLKDSVLVAGCRHRSIYKDLTEDEVRAELRKLEREGKVRHAGDRWVIR